MKTTVLAATLALGLAHAAPQAPLGQGGFRDMLGDLLKANGGSIPHGPAPSGCAKHEILVARGTGEPGAFGVVVGDPLVNAVVDAVPGSRGYAVQYGVKLGLQEGTMLTIGQIPSQRESVISPNWC